MIKPYTEEQKKKKWEKFQKDLASLEKIKNIAIDIKDDDEWVNDDQTQAEYKGVCDGLDMLVNHLEELERNNNG